MVKFRKVQLFHITVVVFILVLFVQINWMSKNINNNNKKNIKQIQQINSTIDYESKKSRFILIARDSVIMKHNSKLSLEEAYNIAEFNLYVCEKYQLNPVLLLAIQRQESCFNSKAVSSAGAEGLCQVMILTAKLLCSNKDIPYYKGMLMKYKANTDLAATYLKFLKAEFNSLEEVLIGYNAGPKWAYRFKSRGIKMMPQETQKYVTSVLAFYSIFNEQLAFCMPIGVDEG